MGREKWVANYGTNGGSAIADKDYNFDGNGAGTDYDTAVMAPSDDWVLTSFTYDGVGKVESVTDNRGLEERMVYDDAGRMIYRIENYDGTKFSSGYDQPAIRNPDSCRVTQYKYNAANLLSEMVAIDPNGDGNNADDQSTRYFYAMDLDESYSNYTPVPNGRLLRAMILPDSDDTVNASNLLSDGTDQDYDRVELTYYADGSIKTRKDQREVLHTLTYDSWRREILDAATEDSDQSGTNSLADLGVDDAVQAIGQEFDSRGRLLKLTSYDGPDTSTASVVNQVLYEYDVTKFDSIRYSYQSHDGAVDTQTTPYVEYGQVVSGSGNAKNVRVESVKYPNGRTVNVLYGQPDSIDSRVNRIAQITDNAQPATVHASYKYAGLSTLVSVTFDEAKDGSSRSLIRSFGSFSDLGGGYGRMDRFDRQTEVKWQLGSDGAVLDHFKFGYDRNSNCLWRENVLYGNFSEMYRDDSGSQSDAYDELNRLVGVSRGTLTLDPGNTPELSIASQQGRERWELDATGNWESYKKAGSGSWTLEQIREHNKSNEIDDQDPDTGDQDSPANPIEAINSTPDWLDPIHDEAGNMITAPMPGNETSEMSCVFDAWNRLAKVQTKVLDSGQWVTVDIQRNQYDGRNRRVARLRATNNLGTSWERRDYYFSLSMQILEERVEQAVVANPDTTVADTAVYQYVWGPEGSGSPILRDENLDPGSDDDCTEDPGTGSQRLFYTFMPNYMVTAMVDTSGAVAERYVYDAYGTPMIYNPAMSSTVTESSSKKNPIRFSSYYYDGVKGASTEWASCLYHVGHRSYHPTLGRWIQKDPLVLTGPSGGYQDGMSLYAYSSASPISRRDPTGLMSEEECRFRLELLDQAAGGPGKASGVYGGNAGCHGETVRRRIKELIVGIHAPEIREMIDRFRNENITLKDSIVLGPLELSAVQGLTVSQAIYYPRLPKIRMQFFIKASFTIKYGRCKCKNGGTQYYLSESWAGELGVYEYKGIGRKLGPKTRFTLPVLETMKECPDQKVSTSCSSGVKFKARASLISASCKYEFGKGWSCGGGIRLRYKDIASIRVTASGVYTCTRTELQGPKP